MFLFCVGRGGGKISNFFWENPHVEFKDRLAHT